jgi:hypothetical protein
VKAHCEASEHPLAACVVEEGWYSFKRNLFGETVQWALTFNVAIDTDQDKPAGVLWIHSISLLTAEEPGVQKAPPFAMAAYNDRWRARRANMPFAK